MLSAVPPTLTPRVQEVLSVPNEVAAELAGVGDGVLDSLRDRLALHASRCAGTS